MNKQDCRIIYFDILDYLENWENSNLITVNRKLLEDSAECILFLLKNYKGE